MSKSSEALAAQIILTQWQTQTSRVDKIVNSLTEEQYSRPIIPGGNTPAWVLAHLTVINDNLLTILDLGLSRFPKLKDIANKPNHSPHSEIELEKFKSCWHTLNTVLEYEFNRVSPQSWFGRHTAVSAEDFEKEPHRNKLNVLLTRTIHLAHHLGQLAQIKQ